MREKSGGRTAVRPYKALFVRKSYKYQARNKTERPYRSLCTFKPMLT